MKKFLCLILALVLCVSVFVACDNTEQPEEPDEKVALDNATAYLKTMYKGYLSNPETPFDFELVTKVTVNEKVYAVEWSVDNNAVKVVVAEDNSKVTIDIDEKSASVVEYNLTAVVTAPDGTKGNPLTFKLKVPKSSMMSISDALKAEDGKFVTVSGTVVLINTPWDDGYKNISVTIEDENGDKLYLYRLATKVEVGDIITVKGEMATYNNARQVAAGATAEITGKEEVNLEYKEMTIPQIIAAEDGALIIVKGTVKSVDIPWSEQYKNISVTIVDAQGNELYIYRLATNVVAGDSITVKGVVGSYNGNKQIAQGATAEIGTAHGNNHVYSFDCDTTCDICGATRDNAAAHTYAFACSTECSVCKTTRTDAAEHTWANACDATCDVCAVTREVPAHVYGGDCDTICNVCAGGERTVNVAHTYDNACDADCNVCAEARTPADHVYDYDCDATCNVCNGTRQAECVDANSDGKCDSCNENMPNAEQIEQNRIAHEKNQLPKFSDVTEDGSVDLPSVGKDYSNVTVVWTSNKACAVIANGKVTFTLGEEEQTVTLTATLTCGSTTDTVTFTIKVAAIPSQEPPVSESNEKKFTIDMLGTTNLTSRTPDKTIYTANSIVYTNDKASSTTDNFDQTGTYAARAYKGSTIKIEFPSMTKIVFILDDFSNGQYLTGFDNMEVTGATITRNNDTVTITFAVATNVFMSAELLSQVRIESIIVYSTADVAGGEEVGDDENAGGDNNNNDDSNGGTTTTLTALTELKNGDVVVIAAPTYNMALSVNKVATYYNAGVDISSGLSGLTNAEKFVVTVNGDGSYTFTSVSGVVIALADSYSSLNEDGANKSWTLEAKDGATGVFYVKNTVRGNYLEWYASMNNWSSYTPSSFTPEYELSFYAAE